MQISTVNLIAAQASPARSSAPVSSPKGDASTFAPLSFKQAKLSSDQGTATRPAAIKSATGKLGALVDIVV
jgi:hypothetical protein